MPTDDLTATIARVECEPDVIVVDDRGGVRRIGQFCQVDPDRRPVYTPDGIEFCGTGRARWLHCIECAERMLVRDDPPALTVDWVMCEPCSAEYRATLAPEGEYR